MADETREMDLSGTAILPADFSKEMRTSFLEYSMSVIIARALPDVRDGLKPVHRRILFAMNEVGVTPTKPHKKSAWTVGEVIGKYHPHGDTAVYDAMVRMAQDFSMRLPLVDGHGNFGSVDGDGAAAMRYTEARLDKAAMELLRDLDKNTVDMQPNYDESIEEPSVLPARFPNLLVNGSSGIAVGMATNVPTHNLGEVIDGAIHLLQNPDATTEELMEYIPGPDFPTGGIIMGTEPIREAYETGRGSLTVRSKCSMEQTSTGKSRIIVSEIPYQVNKSKLIEKIADLVKEKKITEISDLRDESDRKGMRIVIELKKDAVPQVVLNQLYKHTQLQTTFGVNDLALVDGVPRTLSLKEMLHHYLVHQQEVITRRTRFDLEKAEARAHILQGYLLALDNIDEVVQIIKESSDTAEARDNLMNRFGFTEIQADSILEMQLRRLTGLERDKIEKEYAELLEKIDYYQRVLKDPKMVDQIIIDELTEIKEKFADKRRTQILNEEPKDLDIEDLIAEEDMVVTITRSGYVKRLPVATYRQQHRGGKGLQGVNLKDNDFVEQLFVASTHDYMLFFSTKGKVYRLKVHELPVGSRHARGTAIVNLLPFQGDEAIAAVIATKDFPKDEYLVFGTKMGMVKKTSMELYDRSRRDGIIAISLKDGDELIAVRRCKPGKKVVMVSSGGKAIKWDEAEARPMGRDTMGVRGMNVSGEDRVIAMEVADENEDMFVVTEFGYGKRTGVGEYPTHHRGGQGVYTISMTDKKGKLVGMKIVRPGQELMIISEEGVVIRVGAEGISKQGRSTQGVKVMSVTDGDRVCALARVAGGSKKKAAKKSDDGQLDGQAAIVDQAGNLIGSEENAALEQHLANAAAAAAAAEDADEDLADELMAEELEGDEEE